jgi:acetolactate synthase-1/2/3 large subunit
MGFGLPAAMGVKLAFPDRDVACITGEGSIQMCIQELSTMKQYDLPVKIINLNNRYLGMVRQWQQLIYDDRVSGSDLHVGPDWVKLADAMGALGLRASRPDEVEPVIEKMLAHDGPVLVDFVVKERENVYPMVPAGNPSSKMVLSDPDPMG